MFRIAVTVLMLAILAWPAAADVSGPATVINGDTIAVAGERVLFHATVIADAEDQPEGTLDRKDLRRLPMIVPPEAALPVGDGEPGAQIALPGMEPVIESEPPDE